MPEIFFISRGKGYVIRKGFSLDFLCLCSKTASTNTTPSSIFLVVLSSFDVAIPLSIGVSLQYIIRVNTQPTLWFVWPNQFNLAHFSRSSRRNFPSLPTIFHRHSSMRVARAQLEMAQKMAMARATCQRVTLGTSGRSSLSLILRNHFCAILSRSPFSYNLITPLLTVSVKGLPLGSTLEP